MGVIKLSDALGTRYVINALTGSLRSVFDSAVASGDSVDFQGCKFGPDAVMMLQEYYAILDMCNTTDSYLDGILKNNCERSRTEPEPYESLNLRDIKSIDTYMRLVEELPQGAKYKPEVSLSRILDKVTLILLIMTRPDVEFDIRSCSSDVYDYVRDAWLSNAEHHDKYYELIPPDTVLHLPDADGYFGSQTYGYQREASFIRNRIVLPWEFGNTKIITLGGNGVSNEWRLVVEKCLDAFQSSYAEKRSGRVLRNLLTFRGGEE